MCGYEMTLEMFEGKGTTLAEPVKKVGDTSATRTNSAGSARGSSTA